MKLFQTIILGVFGFSLIIAVLIFSGLISIGKGTTGGIGGNIILWGTLPKEFLNESLENLNIEQEDLFSIQYVEKRKETFDKDLIEARASGIGPDMILLPQDLIYRYDDKVLPIPYESMSPRDFRDIFIEEGELYLKNEGILALPFSIDPLVMYWNRNLFSSAGIASPPKYWDEFFTLTSDLTSTDNARNVLKSTVALGEYKNVNHAKDILSLLIFQTGNPIIEKNENGLAVVLIERRGLIIPPAESALRFYTEFSNPSKPFYSWHGSLPSAKDYFASGDTAVYFGFASGDLAIYFGYASEQSEIRGKSPNLNFDMALIPQARDSGRKITFGNMTGVAVLKASRNIQTAFYASFLLSGRGFAQSFSKESSLPSVRRDLLGGKSPSSNRTLEQSALISRGWIDPNPIKTEVIFKDMIEDVVSGRSRISESVLKANERLGALLVR